MTKGNVLASVCLAIQALACARGPTSPAVVPPVVAQGAVEGLVVTVKPSGPAFVAGESAPVARGSSPWRPGYLTAAIVAAAVASRLPDGRAVTDRDLVRLSPHPFGHGAPGLPPVLRGHPYRMTTEVGDAWLRAEVRVDDPLGGDPPLAVPRFWLVRMRAGQGKGPVVERDADLIDQLDDVQMITPVLCGGRVWGGVALADSSSGTNSATSPTFHAFSWSLGPGAAPPRYWGSHSLGSYARFGADASARSAGALYLQPDCTPLGLVVHQSPQWDGGTVALPADWVLHYGGAARCGTATDPADAPDGEHRWIDLIVETCLPDARDELNPTCTLRAALWYPAPLDAGADYDGPGALYPSSDPLDLLWSTKPPSCAWAAPPVVPPSKL